MFEPDPIDPDLPDPSEFIKVCPVCEAGPLKFARRLYRLDICLCDTCGASLNVPHSAWRIRRPEFQPKA